MYVNQAWMYANVETAKTGSKIGLNQTCLEFTENPLIPQGFYFVFHTLSGKGDDKLQANFIIHLYCLCWSAGFKWQQYKGRAKMFIIIWNHY